MKKLLVKNLIPIAWNERFHFECHHCSACCRHVKDLVPLESLDIYRITKYLRGKNKSVSSIEDMLSRYAEPILLHESGYFVYMLKTDEEDDACIFLEDNRCTIQPAKPRACRIYPIVAEPNGSSGFNYYRSTEQIHHFIGRKYKTRDWIKQYFTQEDQAFVHTDISSALSIAKLLRQIPKSRKTEALLPFLIYKYTEYDLDQPFQEQYEQNNQKLIASLEAMIS